MKRFINIVTALNEKMVSRIRRVLSNYFFILKIVWKVAPGYFLLLILIAIIGAVLPLIPLFLSKTVLNILVTNDPSSENTKSIIMLLLASGFVNFFARFTNSIRSFFSNMTVAIVEKRINLLILKKASTIDLHYVDSKDYYFKLDNARRALGRRWDDLVLAPVNLFAHCITLFGLIGILVGINNWLVIVLIAGILPNIIVQIKIRELMNNFHTINLEENRKISYIENILSQKQYAKEVDRKSVV
jgi:ATP-binding cassette subfamily B protein